MPIISTQKKTESSRNHCANLIASATPLSSQSRRESVENPGGIANLRRFLRQSAGKIRFARKRKRLMGHERSRALAVGGVLKGKNAISQVLKYNQKRNTYNCILYLYHDFNG